MTLGMAKKGIETKESNTLTSQKGTSKKTSTSMCDAFDMINRGNMYELGSNV